MCFCVTLLSQLINPCPRLQGGSSQLSCKNEDFSKTCAEKTSKQPVFQIHVDEPDSAGPRRPAAPRVKPAEGAVLHTAMTRLRPPLAPLDLPSAMDVSFGGLETEWFSRLFNLI